MHRFSLLVCAGLLAAGPAVAMDLTVAADGIDPAKGPLMIALFDRADTFDGAPATQDQAVVALRLTPAADRVSLALTGLPDGRYAAAVYQDRNRNGRLDTNVLGIPAEPYGFSGVDRPGRPSFADAAAEGGALRVRMRE